jgi:hypothetical protein
MWQRPDLDADPDPLTAVSGCFTCPCCASISYSPGPVCTGCQEAGCVQSADSTGEVDWWRCQRTDTELDDDTIEFEFDPAAYDDMAVRAERSRDGWVVVEIIELSGDADAEGAQADAAARREAS